ncbi:MAG: pseudouridine synthase [Desulfomicrobium sp.]|jgi:23S rRNA pseudouridine2605 synthase|nr:pseudouridine synthase [Desulfomicrobium sp.]
MPENTPVRLNKYLADAGLASRRGADALIQSGRVSVNGLSQREPGTRVIPGQDTVLLDGNPVAARQDAPASYVMLHKPVHTVTTVNDPQGRRTVVEMLPEDLRTQRLFPVGRLDYMSEGLLLLTNDGDVTLRLTHPSYEHAKKYEVVVREAVTENSLRTMRQGMRLREGERLAPVEVETSVEVNGATLLRMTLRQGVNRQIRRMCRDLNLTILRLRRVELGPLRLEGLESGKWRFLSAEEIKNLKSSLGLG